MQSINYESEGAVRIITIRRPEVRNAVDQTCADELREVFLRFEKEADASVAILTGSDNTFCAGADLKAVSSGKGNQVSIDGPGPMGPTGLLLSKPVIAAIEGYAVAGGLELAIWCDLRVAASDAVLGVYCRRWGVPLVDGGTVRLSRMLGHSHALDLILTGRGVCGEEALRMGLVNRLTEPGQSLRVAKELASTLTQFPQRCMRNDRLSSYLQWSLPQDKALEKERQLGLEVIRSGETLAGAKQFSQGAGRHGRFE